MAIEDELTRLCLEITNHPSIGTTKRDSRVPLYHQDSCATDGETASDKNDLLRQSRQDLFRWICRNEDRRREARGLPGAPLLKSVAAWPDEPTATDAPPAIVAPYIPFVSPLPLAPEVPVGTTIPIGAAGVAPAAPERVLMSV